MQAAQNPIWQGEAHNETSDAANPNVTRTRPTRPEDKLHNPPKGLPSMLLEGQRTGASDKLSEVPNDEMTTLQSMWMLRDESPSGEVHGVARSHKEAGGVDIEGGEASERTCTGDDEERRVHKCINDHETEMASRQVDDEATDTPNPHAKCTGPTRPVGTLHDPANELFGKREGGGMAKAKSVSMLIEGWSGQVATNCADEVKLPGEDLSNKASGHGADASRASGRAEETREKPKKLREASEQI